MIERDSWETAIKNSQKIFFQTNKDIFIEITKKSALDIINNYNENISLRPGFLTKNQVYIQEL